MKRLFYALAIVLAAIACTPAAVPAAQNDQTPGGDASGGTYTIDFTAQGYANQEEVKAYRKDGISLELTNAKWYDNGQSLRVYSSSTITVSAEKVIEKIVFSFGTGDQENVISADKGSFETDTWTGTEGKLVFTVGGSSGHRRITKLEITLGTADAPEDPGTNPGTDPGDVTAGTDVIDVAFTGVGQGGQYAAWQGKGGSVSSAIYAGDTANFQGKALQMRSKNSHSSIVSTTSAGKVKKVKIVWHDQTDTHGNGDRFVEVYGHTMAYDSPANLFQAGTAGTLLAKLKYPDQTEVDVDGNYSYVGLRSSEGAVYLGRIEITWE